MACIQLQPGGKTQCLETKSDTSDIIAWPMRALSTQNLALSVYGARIQQKRICTRVGRSAAIAADACVTQQRKSQAPTTPHSPRADTIAQTRMVISGNSLLPRSPAQHWQQANAQLNAQLKMAWKMSADRKKQQLQIRSMASPILLIIVPTRGKTTASTFSLWCSQAALPPCWLL